MKIRLAEVVASLALATDMATGQALESGLRRALLAIWMGEKLGLPPEDMSTTYYVALLGSVGCILDGAVFADYVPDEISVRQRMITLDPTNQFRMASFFLSVAGAGDPPLKRAGKFISLSRQSHAVCRDVALQVGRLLDLGPAIRAALGQCEEHWNGKGPVLGLKGEDIQFAARLFILCHDVEVFNRVGGVDAAMTVVRERAGRVYDPQVASCFLESGADMLHRLQSEPAWDSVLASEPEPVRFLDPPDFEDVAGKVANFVDIRSPFTVGHSTAVANCAALTARQMGLPRSDQDLLRHAGLLHDLGRCGVPVSFWNKKDSLSAGEIDRMKGHPSLTELILAHSTALGPLGTIAGLHHERMDGSGYRGVGAASMPITARVLAAADCFQTKLEARPHRLPLAPEQAAVALREHADKGALDGDVVAALLTAAGHPEVRTVAPSPAGLSDREVEVLRLAVQGLSNRQIADMLVISPKTVGHHIENIYNKIGVSTRVGATLFAVSNGLINPE